VEGQRGPRSLAGEWWREVVLRYRETALLALPASLYVLQNNLLILALTHLDAATYQVTYQLKLLTTAGCSVLLLGAQLPARRWAALLLLLAGVALVQLPSRPLDSEATEQLPNEQNRLLGLLAVVIACCSSGFAGTYYERLVKHSAQPSLLVRNLQLGLFSLVFSLAAMLAHDGWDLVRLGPTHGYTPTVMAVIGLQSVGGLVVAATIKYADNILKGFATSVSIVVSGAVSWAVVGDPPPGPAFLPGSGLVLAASLLYCWPPAAHTAPASLRV
jgi:UDP-sugar transporter A1/2/3